MKVCVIGGGASGMLCAALLAERGFSVDLFEKNEKLGKKLFITGKGRCNLTNDCTEEIFFDSISNNPRFLYSAYRAFSAQDAMLLFSKWGLSMKTERGNRVFPSSDHAYDVTDMLKRRLRAGNVRVHLNTRVTDILTEDVPLDESETMPLRRVRAVLTAEDKDAKKARSLYVCDRVILAAGGLSYPSTGACGDGMLFAERLGLAVTPCSPSLVSLNCEEECCQRLQGLSLKNVTLYVKKMSGKTAGRSVRGGKMMFKEFGELMFTHYGITGPIVLKASSRLGSNICRQAVFLDLKPAISEQELDERYLRLITETPNRRIQGILRPVFPSDLGTEVILAAGIQPEKKGCELTKEERRLLVRTTKQFPLTVTSLRGYEEAVVTKGGISVREINPATMEARKIKGLYIIGEVLDVDALTGGFNLQIAWTTAAAAARA